MRNGYTAQSKGPHTPEDASGGTVAEGLSSHEDIVHLFDWYNMLPSPQLISSSGWCKVRSRTCSYLLPTHFEVP